MYRRPLAALSFAVLLAAGGGATAQTEADDAARRAEARAQLQELEARAGRLPPAPAPTRGRLPDPDPAALLLLRQARELHRLNEDLPEGRRMGRVAARAARVAFDPVAALAILDRLEQSMAAPAADPGAPIAASARVALEVQAAEERPRIDAEAALLLAEFGAPAEAIRRIDRAIETAGAGALPDWRKWRGEWEAAAKAQDAERSALAEARRSPERAAQVRAQHAARRFASTWPLDAGSAGILVELLAALKEAPEAARRPFAEALALFHPAAPGAADLGRGLAVAFAAEGDYEKALLHAERLLDRSEALPGAAVGELTALAKDLRTKLARIAGRGLPPGRSTRLARLADLEEAIRRGDDVDLAMERTRAFAEDYPNAASLPALRLAAAKALMAARPEKARDALEPVARDHASTPEGCEAILAIAGLIEGEDGAEAAEAWLAKDAPKPADPLHRAAIDLRRAEILSRLERFDDALQVLEPHAGLTDDDLAPQIRAAMDTARRGKED